MSGHNIQRAVDQIASANGVSNKVNYLIYSHHPADHGGASSLFGKTSRASAAAPVIQKYTGVIAAAYLPRHPDRRDMVAAA